MNVISQEGVDFIKKWEGFSDKPYADVVGYMTIGYGHLIKDGESFTVINHQDAETLLRSDLQQAVKAVNDLVTTPISQNEFDALVSFTYNLGKNAFRNSTLLRILNSGAVEAAADQFLRWDHAGGKKVEGLANRRSEERRMFLHG